MEKSTRKLSFKARNPEETREKILVAAIDEFAEFGFPGARVERIAQRSDVKMRMLYHYYKSKEYLYGFVLNHVFESIELAEEAFETGAGTAEDRIREIIDFTFNIFVQNPEFIQLTMGENLLGARHLSQLKSAGPRHEPLKSAMRRALEEGQAAGAFRGDIDPEQLWITIYSLCWAPLSNRHTLSAAPAEFLETEFLDTRLRHNQEIVLAFLRA